MIERWAVAEEGCTRPTAAFRSTLQKPSPCCALSLSLINQLISQSPEDRPVLGHSHCLLLVARPQDERLERHGSCRPHRSPLKLLLQTPAPRACVYVC
jgi:hypothetical protein